MLLPRYTKQGDKPLCFNACISSILDIDIDDIPFLWGGDKTDWGGLQKWLGDKHNLQILAVKLFDNVLYPITYPVVCIVSGPSYRSTKEKPIHHACVGLLDFDELKFLHDPHDSNTFIPSVDIAYFFVPLRKFSNEIK